MDLVGHIQPLKTEFLYLQLTPCGDLTKISLSTVIKNADILVYRKKIRS